jgi:hypothetical protein
LGTLPRCVFLRALTHSIAIAFMWFSREPLLPLKR